MIPVLHTASAVGSQPTVLINTQKLADDTVVNLNTSASGMSAYLTPSIFYSFGDRGFRENDYRAFKVGLGYLSAAGGLVLTEEVGQPTYNLDISGFGVSNSAFIEYHRDRWLYRLRGMGHHSVMAIIATLFMMSGLGWVT